MMVSGPSAALGGCLALSSSNTNLLSPLSVFTISLTERMDASDDDSSLIAALTFPCRISLENFLGSWSFRKEWNKDLSLS